MKKRLLVLAVCLLLAFLCFFLLCTDVGHDLTLHIFPSANLENNQIIWHFKHEEEHLTESRFLSEELPGTYALVEVTSPEFSLSSDELDAIRSLGIPLQLELLEDGSAVINVFDMNRHMVCDADNMLFRSDEESLFFFYLDGSLTIVDGDSHLVFEKALE